ncbi:MAG: HigA family addiction module antidote protein [Pseudomonadales bacterium]|nr:HigA family addiction module antidote protein [Pseudomonadales bacterium]
MAELLDEIHPGEILLEEFMKPMGITARQLAADMDVSPSRISELVNGRRPITADTALRLGLYFGMDARFWMNLQTEYDMRVATRELKDKIAPRIRVHEHIAAPGAFPRDGRAEPHTRFPVGRRRAGAAGRGDRRADRPDTR